MKKVLKKILVSASLSLLLVSGVSAQYAKNTSNNATTLLAPAKTTQVTTQTVATISWKSTVYDFGKIAQDVPVAAEFSFKNTGKTPIIVKSAQGSCGCTVTEFPQTPILPNQTAVIKGTFNAKAVGAFAKTITVETNAETTVLNFKGEVLAGK